MNQYVIGGVQLGTNYGMGTKKTFPKSDLKKLYLFCKKKKIQTIDTAHSYRNSEQVIGNSDLQKLKIITKISINEKKKNTYLSLKNRILKSLKILKKKKLKGLLIHNQLSYKNFHIVEHLFKLKNKDKLFDEIGLSVYDPEYFFKITKSYNFDLVQVPFNVLDQRFNNYKFFNYTKKNEIKVYARSIFLQGLLLNKKTYLNDKNFNYRSLKKFWNYCDKKNIPYYEFCLNFVKKNKNIDKIVIGFNSLNELKQIVNYKQKNITHNYKYFSSLNKKLIDPRKWKKEKY